MAKLAEIWRRILFSFKRSRMDNELAEEMRQHMDFKVQKNMAAGMSEEEARYAAHRQLGNLTRMEEESRKSWGFPMLESFLQDIRYGLRGLRKAPGFTTVAVLTLALGIGATTVIFSVINTVVLRPLPYKDSARLARVRSVVPRFPDFKLGVSKPDFDDIKASAHSLESVAVFQERDANLTAPGDPKEVVVSAVTPEFFTLLGLSPNLGRILQPDDVDRKNGDVVLISSHLWRQRFASSPTAIGRTITLDEKHYTVVGVMPDGPVITREENDIWMPLNIPPKDAAIRTNWFFSVLARIRQGQTLQSAQAELDTIAQRLGTQYPTDESGIKFDLESLQHAVIGNTKSGLMLLLGAVGFLLLIACANVSNLILSRAVQRQSEIAVRVALGASRVRILRQLLVESLLLSCLGGAAGILLAIYGVNAYRAFGGIPRANELHVDFTIAWVALAFSSLAGILCGLAPALHTSRPDMNLALKERVSSGAEGGSRRLSLRDSLVVLEVALALVLLDGSALMVQSMVRMMHVDPGFHTSNILTADLNLPSSRYATPESRTIFVQKLLDTLRANDRFKNVALSDSPALNSNLKMMMFQPGTLGVDDKSSTLQERTVGPGYFETLNIPLRAGRTFDENDVKGTTKVAVVNEAMMRQYFSGKPPIGKILKYGDEPDDQSQIVGVVADTRDVTLRSAPRPQVYLPLLQHPDFGIYVFVRTSADPLAMAPELEKLVWSIDKDQPVNDVQSLTQVIADSVSEPRFRTWVLGIFAFAGLTLTLVGIYGVISYMVGQRTREIGIRVALGAQRGNVLGLVLAQGIRLTIAGAILGVLGSVALTRFLRSELFDIKPTDAVTLIGAAAAMLLVALAACYLPARRATHVDPLEALRYE